MRTKSPLFFICIIACSLVVAQMLATTTPVEAQENGITSIRPGGSYNVVVQVHKPSYIALPETIGPNGWEIRIYFYNGTNCYNIGGWWNPSGYTWLYTGWWIFRLRAEAWSGTPEDKTFVIPNVQVVNYPRGDEGPAYPPSVGPSYENKMGEIPVPGSVSLRAHLIIKNINHEIDGQYVTFTVGGVKYRYQYTVDTYGDLLIGDPVFAEVDPVEDRLIINQTMPIEVSYDAPATGTIYMTAPIDIALAYVEPPIVNPETPLSLIIIISAIVAVAIVAVIFYIASRRTPEEEFEL